MMLLRQWHTYIGAFIAPSVLFFALTGAVQLFSLLEAHDGYKPPVLIEKLAAVHKDQEFRAKEHHGGPPARGADAASDDGDHHDADTAKARPAGVQKPKSFDAAQIRTWALKWVFVVVALGLVASTLIGLWMAFIASQRKGVVLVVLLIGAALPVLLLAL